MGFALPCGHGYGWGCCISCKLHADSRSNVTRPARTRHSRGTKTSQTSSDGKCNQSALRSIARSCDVNPPWDGSGATPIPDGIDLSQLKGRPSARLSRSDIRPIETTESGTGTRAALQPNTTAKDQMAHQERESKRSRLRWSGTEEGQ